MRWGRVTSVSFALLEQAERQRANLDPLAFLDVVGAVGYYSLVSMVLNVAQVPLPAGVEPPLK